MLFYCGEDVTITRLWGRGYMKLATCNWRADLVDSAVKVLYDMLDSQKKFYQ